MHFFNNLLLILLFFGSVTLDAASIDSAAVGCKKKINDYFISYLDANSFAFKFEPPVEQQPEIRLSYAFPTFVPSPQVTPSPEVDAENLIHQKCIARSMQDAPIPYSKTAGWQYGQCKNHKLYKYVPRHCTDTRLTAFVTDAVTEVSNCLGMSRQELFSIYNVESSFQLNIKSHTGVWGIAQTTGDAIKDIYNGEMIDRMAVKTECANLKRFFDYKYKTYNSCDWMEIGDNPKRSLLYGGLLLLEFKEAAQGLIDLTANTRFVLSDLDKEKLKYDLTFTMYNAGQAGLTGVFRAFIVRYKKQPLTLDDVRIKLKDYISKYYGGTTTSAARKSEVSRYTPVIREKSKAINAELGVSCGLEF